MGWGVVKSRIENEDRRALPTGTLDISKVSYGEDSYQDGNDWEWERNLGAQTLDISSKSFGENEYWDSGDWQYERNLVNTLDISPTSFGENEYWDSNDWYYERRLGGQLEVETVDADDLGDWYSDYERRLGAQTLDISSKSFGENEYWDSGDWQYERNLIQTQRINSGSTLVIPNRLQ